MAAAARAEGERGDADRGLALIRLVAVPVIVLSERLVEAPGERSGAFLPILAAAAVYAAASLAVAFSRYRRRVAPAAYVGLDLVMIAALSVASGGETSAVRHAFFLPPLAAAFLLRPSATVLTSVATVIAYGAVALLDPPVEESSDPGFALSQGLYVAWFGLAATVFCRALTARERRVEELVSERGRLVAQAIDAEERERCRISQALHDEAVQNLLAARLDLAEARAGDAGALDRVAEEVDRTLAQIRASVADLHPIAFEQGGLVAALEAIAERGERRGGFRASVRVADDATGVCDQLLISLGRELLSNAAKHARASRVSLVLEREGEDIVLEVCDDGVSIPPGRRATALREGHIGLASSAERVKALGGQLEVASEPAHGTTVRARIPIAACGAGAP